jgi:two-component system cell cycle sensor histidine kinase/response regulator CckA
MFEDAPIGMTLVSADERILQANRAFCELLGYSAPELAGTNVLDVTYPDDRDETTRVIRRIHEGGARIEGHQKRYVRKNGEVVWGEVNISIITDVDGKLIHTIAQIVDITERRRAEEALRENEETIRALLNATTDEVFLLDTAGVILAVNETGARAWGRSVEQLAGACAYDFMSPAVAESRRAHFARCIQSGQPLHFEDEHRGIWFDTVAYPIRDSRGEVKQMAVFARDVTERKRADEALRESEARFRSTFEDAPIGIALVSMDYRFLQVNRAHCKFLGYSAQELVGMAFLDITHPEDKDANFRASRVMREGGPRLDRFQKRSIRKNGEVVWGEVSASVIRDTDGKPIHVIAQIVDITERKRAEQALRESEQRYRELFEASPIPLIEEDCTALRERAEQMRAEGVSDVRAWFLSHPEEAQLCFQRIQHLDVNKAALRLFKAADKREFLMNVGRVGGYESRDTAINAIAALAVGDEFFEAETSLQTLAGEKRNVLVSISSVPVAEQSLARYIVSLSDVTDLRRAQQEAIEQRQAAQLQRMESLAVTGRLAAGVAHEINNPLQGIVSQLTLLAGELPEPLRQGRRIELIQDGIDRIAGIVRNLLQLHRPAPVGEESCAVSSVIPGLADMISAMTANQHIRLEVSVSPPEMTVPVSASALMQVLLNLVLNAIDAMPQGGILRIEAKRTAEAVVVGVSDTGVGIPPEHRTQLFSPFFTTKGPKGTGLGLSVTYSLVTSAGGTITVNDQKGGGTTFAIRFGK